MTRNQLQKHFLGVELTSSRSIDGKRTGSDANSGTGSQGISETGSDANIGTGSYGIGRNESFERGDRRGGSGSLF